MILLKGINSTAMAPSNEVNIQVGEIFWSPTSVKAESLGIETSLTGKAFGHMILVLGKRPDHEGHWRIMTVSLNTHTYSGRI